MNTIIRKTSVLLGVGILLSLQSAQAILITLNSGIAPQPANGGQGTIEPWIADAVTAYNIANNPDLPAPGSEVFRVNTGDASPGAGYPAFGSDTLSITLSTVGYDYVALHWGGSGGGMYQSFYIGDVSDPTISFAAPARNGLSWYDAFHPRETSVPDGGSTLLLLGSAVTGFGLLKRRFLK